MNPPPAASPRPAGEGQADRGPWWRDLGAAVLAGVVSTLPVSLVSALAVQIRESLRFGTGALGLAVALYFLGAAVASVPLSVVSERIGGARVMRGSAVATAVLLTLVATAAASWITLAGLLLVAGMSSSAMQPAVNLFLARRMPSRRRGLAFGIKQAAIPLAATLAGLAVPGIALTLGWRWAFGLAAVLAGAAAVLLNLQPAAGHGPGAGRPAPRGQPGGSRVPVVVLTAGFGLGICAATGLWSFLVTAGVAAGLGKAAAGVVAALSGAAAIAVRVGTGAVADRRGRGHFEMVAALLAVGAAGYGILAAGFVVGAPWLFAVGAIFTLGTGWGFNGLFNFAVVQSHLHAPARATGLTAVGGRLGGVAGPLVTGFIIVHVSYAAAWAFSGVVALASAAVITVGSRLLARHPVAEFPGGPLLPHACQKTPAEEEA